MRASGLTFDEALARKSFNPIVVITIEGVGDSVGAWKFCNRVPLYATGSLYKPWLTEMPSTIGSNVEVLGGIASNGQLSFTLLDVQTGSQDPGRLTMMLGQDELDPVCEVSASLTSISQTNISLNNAGALTAGDIVWFNAEAMRVSSISGSVATMNRGHLNTALQKHGEKAKGYLQNPIFLNRRVQFDLTFDECSEAEEYNLGSFYVSALDEPTLNTYAIKAIGANDEFSGKEIASNIALEGTITRATTIADIDSWSFDIAVQQDVYSRVRGLDTWNGYCVFLIDDKQLEVAEGLATLTPGTYRGSIRSTNRGIARTLSAPIEVGMEIRQVLYANKDVNGCAFRFQEAGTETTSRTTGVWKKSDHPIDILLCLLCSSRNTNDGLEVNNYTSGKGHWACLPSGWGIGIPASRIDFNSFLDAKARLGENCRLPNFIIKEPSTFGSFIEKQILIPFGLILDVNINGLITCRLPKDLITFDTNTADVGVADVLTRNNIPDITLSYETDKIGSSVRFKSEFLGVKRTIEVKDTDFPQLFRTSDISTYANRVIEIECDGLSTDSSGNSFLKERRGLAILSRYRKPYIMFGFSTDISFIKKSVGQTFIINLPVLPQLGLKRGWVDRVGYVVSKSIAFDRSGLKLKWKCAVYDGNRGGLLCPSAFVLTSTSTASGSIISVSANKYTEAGSISPSITGSDAGSFRVNDVVRPWNDRAGTDPDSTGTIVIIDGNNLHLLDTAPAVGTILEYDDRDAQTDEQAEDFVSLADRATRTIGSSTDKPKRYTNP